MNMRIHQYLQVSYITRPATRGAARLLGCALVLGLVLVATPDARAINWVSGQTGDWSVGSNWDGGSLPTFGDLARFGSGALPGDAGGEEATIDSFAAVADRFIIGQNTPNPTRVSTVILNSGSLTTDNAGAHRIGQSSVGRLIVNGGTLTVAGDQTIGSGATGDGTLTVNGGDVNFNAGLNASAAGSATINVTGSSATFDVTGALSGNANATWNFVADNTLAGVTSIDNTGLFTLTGGILNIDLRGWGPPGGPGYTGDIVLFDYGTLSGTFDTVNVIGGYGTLDYIFDQGGGDLAIALTDAVGMVVPEPSTVLLLGLGGSFLYWFRRRNRA